MELNPVFWKPVNTMQLQISREVKWVKLRLSKEIKFVQEFTLSCFIREISFRKKFLQPSVEDIYRNNIFYKPYQMQRAGKLKMVLMPVNPWEEFLMKMPFETRRMDHVIVVTTDAPLGPRNLKRLAKRAIREMAKTGGIASNGSGDYVIAFSTFNDNRIPYFSKNPVLSIKELNNNNISPLFLAVIEATEEAILNSLFMTDPIQGSGHMIPANPNYELVGMIKKRIE